MAARNKKTTMAKLNRETKLREKRMEKKARKEARRLAAASEADGTGDPDHVEEPEAVGTPAPETAG